MSTKHTKEYFIEKFRAIPEDRWTTHAFSKDAGQCCAAGHCGDRGDIESPEEARALYDIVRQLTGHDSLMAAVTSINDGQHPDYPQPTPKQRILAALEAIK